MTSEPFSNLDMRGWAQAVGAQKLAAFVREMTDATSRGDAEAALNVGYNFGLDVGIALCQRSATEMKNYELRQKDDWEKQFRRANGRKPHWKTIAKHVRWKECPESVRYAYVHVDDLGKSI